MDPSYGEDVSGYTNAVDMWSLGCVVYWVLTKSIPFSAQKSSALADFIRDPSIFPARKLQDKGVTDEGVDFLKQVLVAQPRARMTAARALGHPWLKGVSSYARIEDKIARVKELSDIRYFLSYEFLDFVCLTLQSKNDYIIAVLGPTGSGKSSFISLFPVEPPPHTGSSLQSGS
jgi:serine/threonine protein kinase